MAQDPSLAPYTVYERRQVRGTTVSWDQPVKILPIDAGVRELILAIEREYEALLAEAELHAAHLPSRVRSLLWILASLEALAALGLPVAEEAEVRAALGLRLPRWQGSALVASA